MNINPTFPPTLRHAAQLGHVEMLEELMQEGMAIGELDNAPIRWALRHRHSKIVQRLLAAGADITDNAEEFLHLAAKNGDTVSLKALLKFMKVPILPNALDLIFYDTIQSRNPAAVKISLRAGANPTSQNNRPVMEAACAGSEEILQLLHKHGADLHAQDGQALFNAVMGEHWQAIIFLCLARVDANARSGIAIALAVSKGHAEIVELLLAYGARLAHGAQIADAADEDSLETLLLLIEKGYEFSPYANEVVASAGKSASPRVLKYVLERETVHPLTLIGALENSVRKASEKCVDILIEHGAVASWNQSLCLKIAVDSREFGIARKLIYAGAMVSDLNPTAVVYAIESEDWEFLVMLLQYGIPIMPAALHLSYALKFFRHITAKQLLRDGVGDKFPDNIIQDRQIFVKNIGAIATNNSSDDAIAVGLWITGFLLEMNSMP